MPCIERHAWTGVALAVCGWLTGCAQGPLGLPGNATPSGVNAPAAPAAPLPPPVAQVASPPASSRPAEPPAPGSTPRGAAAPAGAANAPAARPPKLEPPRAARSWDEFKLQAAQRLMAANPDQTYTGDVPDPLLAIPVLEVELNADGSVRRVQVLRHPSQARDTTQIAIDAVHRAAPYGNMSRLPLPWKWAEVFLFDDTRRFKPRILDK